MELQAIQEIPNENWTKENQALIVGKISLPLFS